MWINSRQRIIKSALLLPILFSLVIAGCTKYEIKNVDSRGKNIICFGDSITFGYGVNPDEDYPTNLSKMLDIPVINRGIDGNTSSEALSRFEHDVLDDKPLLVIIEFCGNDFITKIPVETSVSNIRKMIEATQAKGAMTAIVDVSAGFFLANYRSAFKSLAQETGSIFVPSALNGIITNPSMKSDFLHPNATGYKIIASRVYRAIIPYLNKNTIYKRFGKQ